MLGLLQIDFPKRHDLDALRQLVPSGLRVREAQLELSELTEWVVEARYPGDWAEATRDDARRAITHAAATVEAAITDFERGA